MIRKLSHALMGITSAAVLVTSASWSPPAAASDPFIAQLQYFPYSFAPRGWAFCNGQLLSISSYTALFSLVGTTYGGDGRTTLGIPDMRGRAPIHPGRGPGLSPYN
ncbi:MAG: tail fiber protein, partial [Gammaproteobacteria bacterium]